MAKKKKSIEKKVGSIKAKSKKKKTAVKEKVAGDKIAIDEEKGLVFPTEEELYEYFSGTVETLEQFFFHERNNDKDLDAKRFDEFDECLSLLLEDPLEIWDSGEDGQGHRIFNYIGEFEDEENEEDEPIYYIAQVYLSEGVPTFVYLHFPTVDDELVEKYRVGQLVFDQGRGILVPGAMEGDALSEGDRLAVGLYQSMLKLRSESDIAESNFHKYIELREASIEEADEIWQSIDLDGNVLVTFVREFPDFIAEGSEKDKEQYYLVITVEEADSGTHALLFSFPTNDRNLVDRYRHGENLQSEEVIPQSNH